MKRTSGNISLLNAFLTCVLEFNPSYIPEWDAFYVHVNNTATYIKWDLVEEAYKEHCRKLLKLK